MLLTEIDRVSSKTAEKLSNNGFKVAESVAYAPIHKVTAVPSVDAKVYENAQKLVDEQSSLDQGYLRNGNYWCTQCVGNPVFNTQKFSTYAAAVSHHLQCEGCDVDYDL